jgi:pentatricopeptide repeat protein
MVFKPFTNLARQSISKHLVNGYAQSVVAASQSSYASSTLPLHRIGQTNAPAKLHNAFGGAHNGRTAPGKDGQGSDAVNSFYAAQSTGDDKEERKYLFSKKILWSKAQHQQQQKQLLGNPPEPIAEPLSSRSRSSSITSATAELVETDSAALLDIDGVEEEAVSFEEPVSEEAIERAEIREVVAREPGSPVLEPALLLLDEAPSATTQYNQELQRLCDDGRHQEIGVLFQHMVQEGIKPNTASYNLLLASIVSMRPRYVAQVVDVYKAMLKEKLIPSTATYSILIEFLSVRALESLLIAKNAEHDASRFGVMLESRNNDVNELQNEAAMDLALSLFYASTEVRKERTYPGFVYGVLIQACSKYGRDEDMLNVYAHMETHGVPPTSNAIRSLIRGFGRTGDMRSAIETYNCYQEMEMAQDPDSMDQRYQVYRDLIRAYMDGGDPAGALSFLEKVVDISRDRPRLEWLTQAVIEGFVSEGDIESAKKWSTQLSLRLTDNKWLARIMTRVADQGELLFTRQIYNSFNFDNMNPAELEENKFNFAQGQMAALALCVQSRRVENARSLWSDLGDRERSAGPNISALLGFTDLLFETGASNEAVVVLKQFSDSFLERYTHSPEETFHPDIILQSKELALLEAFDFTIIRLAKKGLLTPGIALDISGFSVQFCGSLGIDASRIVLQLFNVLRMQGLTIEQLTLIAELQVSVIERSLDRGASMRSRDILNFQNMFHRAVEAGFPIAGPLGAIFAKGVAILAPTVPRIASAWTQYFRPQIYTPPPTPTTTTAVHGVLSVQATSLINPEQEALPDANFDPYRNKIDTRTSDNIDATIERSRFTRVNNLRNMYSKSHGFGKALRLTTLANIVGAVARTATHEDFIEEIIRNARIDTPPMPQYPTSKFGWSALLDAMIAAHLNLGHRDKANNYHDEILSLGCSPSANTFGLYIVSLKGTYRTYDEASEAMAIFARAKAENVVPTSFLYNALIGKLAKARRVEDCIFFFAEMRGLGIIPTSVTYGTMINAVCRVGDDQRAEELFDEMEEMENYRPRAAPYNSLMQYLISGKRDRAKVLGYYQRMLRRQINPTSHTYKLLIEAYATLEPTDMASAHGIIDTMRSQSIKVESCHHSTLIHAKGCVLHDITGAIDYFTEVMSSGQVAPDCAIYQALLESLVANHRVEETTRWVQDMKNRNIQMTPYIANTLIHGWAPKDIAKAQEVYVALVDGRGGCRREPSTYEAMTRAYLAVGDNENAKRVATEMSSRGYPPAVEARVWDLLRGAGV